VFPKKALVKDKIKIFKFYKKTVKNSKIKPMIFMKNRMLIKGEVYYGKTFSFIQRYFGKNEYWN